MVLKKQTLLVKDSFPIIVSWLTCQQAYGFDWCDTFTLNHLEVISHGEKQGALVLETKFILLPIKDTF